MRRIRTFDSLSIRDYRLLWLGQVSTSMGQWMDQVTRGWLIYQLTGSPTQLGLATASRGLPLLLFGAVAGALADRSGRKLQLVVAQVTNAALNVILATLVLAGLVEPWHVYLSGFLAGTVQAFQQPARQTLVSDIVGPEKLMNALALNSAALNASRAIGPAAAGAFIAVAGVSGSYYLQGAMYAIATIWTFQMRVPEAHLGAGERARESFFSSIREGFRYVAAEGNIRTQMLIALGPLTFAMSYTSLMPVIARDVLGGDAATQGTLLSFIGVGALVGALTVASMRRSHAYGLSVVLGAAAFSTAVFLFSWSEWFWVSCALGFVVGLFNVTYQTQNQTLLQLSAPPRIRGRVMSIYLLNRGTVPFGALLAGVLASHFGGQNAIHIMSLSALAILAVVVVSRPQILRLAVPLTAHGPRTGTPAPREAAVSPEGDPTTLAGDGPATQTAGSA
ncbi:MAG: MFS transporter [Dehalococcoidia bacterium]